MFGVSMQMGRRTRVSDQRIERAAVAELREVVLHEDDQVLRALVARPLDREAALVLVARANGRGHSCHQRARGGTSGRVARLSYVQFSAGSAHLWRDVPVESGRWGCMYVGPILYDVYRSCILRA